MITLLGSLLGFVTSFAPDFLGYVRERGDRAHELAVMRLQIEAQERLQAQRLEEINVAADIGEARALQRAARRQATGVAWVDAALELLISSVRPVITYAYFALFAAVKGTQLYALIVLYDAAAHTALATVWDETSQATFAAVLSFWFGQRAMQRFRGGA